MKLKPYALLLVAGLLGGCFLNPVAGKSLEEAVKTSGTLSEDTIWKGVVRLGGDLVVPAGVTLTIQPGTQVEMVPDQSNLDVDVIREMDGEEINLANEGKVDLVVEGTLKSLGTRFQPVVIGTKGERIIGWGSLILTGAQQETQIRRTEIRYASVGITTLDTAAPVIEKSKIRLNAFGLEAYQDSAPKIRHSRITGNSVGLSLFGSSSPMIRDNTFWGNVNGIDVARSASPKIENNWIMKQQNTAIFSREASTPVITDNTVMWNQTGLNLRDHTKPHLDGNWFLWNGEKVRDERQVVQETKP